MEAQPATPLSPRKRPIQARSLVTIDAIHTATVQVLLADGASRLTTTRVAERAGVSVGTLYQYYPHKQALLFALVEREYARIETAMLTAAERLAGRSLSDIAEGLAVAWLDAKTANITTSRALYGIAGEFDLTERMARGVRHMAQEFARLIASAPDSTIADPEAAAFMIAALLGGSVRFVLETDDGGDGLARLRSELPRACRAYLVASNR